MPRTWQEIIHSGDLTNDLLVAELESAILHSEHEQFAVGFAEGKREGALGFTGRTLDREIRTVPQSDWESYDDWVRSQGESYGD